MRKKDVCPRVARTRNLRRLFCRLEALFIGFDQLFDLRVIDPPHQVLVIADPCPSGKSLFCELASFQVSGGTRKNSSASTASFGNTGFR